MSSRTALGIVATLTVCMAIVADWLRPTLADDWPQWRGPHRRGISAETGLLREWPPEGPTLVWQLKDLGDGYSTPVVVGDRLLVQGNSGLEYEYVLAIDLRGPKQLWKTRLGNVGKNNAPAQYPATRGTPTIDGEALYALGSDGDLVCLNVSDGQPRWRKNLRTDFGGQMGLWAYSESPLIDGDVLVCAPGGSEATIVALHKKSGEIVWKTILEGGDQAGYASAIIIEVDGVKQYVEFMQKSLVGVDAKTGKLLWSYDRTAKSSMASIATPVERSGMIYTSGGMTSGGLVKLTSSQGNVEATEVYFSNKLPNAIGGSVEVNGYLYGCKGPTLMCADFSTGELKWENRCVGVGSVCWADGLLYVHGEDGDVALVEATPEEYREKGRFTPPDQPERTISKAWPYPIVAHGKLYLRDKGSLWCYDIKAK